MLGISDERSGLQAIPFFTVAPCCACVVCFGCLWKDEERFVPRPLFFCVFLIALWTRVAVLCLVDGAFPWPLSESLPQSGTHRRVTPGERKRDRGSAGSLVRSSL